MILFLFFVLILVGFIFCMLLFFLWLGLFDKNLKCSSLYGNVNYLMVVNDVLLKESICSEVFIDINKIFLCEELNVLS